MNTLTILIILNSLALIGFGYLIVKDKQETKYETGALTIGDYGYLGYAFATVIEFTLTLFFIV